MSSLDVRADSGADSVASSSQVAFQRAVQKAISKLPSQTPTPSLDEISLSPLTSILRDAESLRKTQNDSHISPLHILPALIKSSPLAPVLSSLSLPVQVVADGVDQVRAGKRVDGKDADRAAGGDGDGEFLTKYCVDMTKLAEDGKLDPVVGRDGEIRRVRPFPLPHLISHRIR